jgi:signal transduction histidine kinase
MSSTRLLKLLINKNSDLYIESMNHNFDIIEQNSNRLLRLVNNIIDIAKTDSNAIDLNLQNINIVELVENTVLSIVPYAQIKNIDVVFDTDVEEIITAVDIEKIERVLLNLLSNAIKFSNYNGSIYTSIYLEDNNIILKVKDKGIGIEKTHFKNIFKKFHQVDNGFTRHNEGSGIGLSIVGSFIELHGGNVSVSSLKGLGTTFTVSLPINTTCQDVNNNFLSSDKNVDIELSDIYFDRYANN